MEMIKELRARTHLGMTECKKALEVSGGDLNKAIEFLQKKGLKKVDDLLVPLEGIVQAGVLQHILFGKCGFIAEVNSQTDFGAKVSSEVFQKFVKGYVSDPNIPENMLHAYCTMLSKQLGEKIVVRRTQFVQVDAAVQDRVVFCAYNHLGGKIAVLVEGYALSPDRADIKECLENIAMQIAAMKPLAVNRNEVSAELVAKKTALFEEDIKSKPEAVRNKIVEGKLNKWYSEVVLLEQDAIFTKEASPKQTIKLHLNKLGAETVKINSFIRYERGEEIK